MTQIVRNIPNDIYQALKAANSPNSGNAFVTMADISSAAMPIHVSNYSAFPDPTTVSGAYYFADNSQGSSFWPGRLGGTYYPEGLYYSDGAKWIYPDNPYQASQATVDAGVDDKQYVTPKTLNDSEQLKRANSFAKIFTFMGS